MTHRLSPRQYATLAAVVFTASFGDALLSRGMTQVGPVNFHHLLLLLHALANLNVIVGIVLLIGFFASYMSALSWADLTFVMPATAFGNVVIALLSRFFLHEHLSLSPLDRHSPAHLRRRLRRQPPPPAPISKPTQPRNFLPPSPG